MNSESVTVVTPTARIVAGDVFKANDKDSFGNPQTVKTGPNAGQPTSNIYIGLAIPKTDPEWPQIHDTIIAIARAGFPHLFDANGQCLKPDFAFKITDGDSAVPNSKGNKPCDREGYPGHWILNCSTSLIDAVKVYQHDPSSDTYRQIMDGVKKGDYVKVEIDIRANDNQQNPGVYLNPKSVLFVGHGEAIISGPDPSAIFGGGAPALPPGASATPVASTPHIPQSAPTPAPAASPAPAPQSAPAPQAHEFLNVPAAPPEPSYQIDGRTYTRSALEANGWTEAQIATLVQVS